MARQKFNAFRDERVHVCEHMCKTCIYLPTATVGEEIKEQAVTDNNAVICHNTLPPYKKQAVCYGFWVKDRTPLLHLAEAMGLIKFDKLHNDL